MEKQTTKAKGRGRAMRYGKEMSRRSIAINTKYKEQETVFLNLKEVIECENVSSIQNHNPFYVEE